MAFFPAPSTVFPNITLNTTTSNRMATSNVFGSAFAAVAAVLVAAAATTAKEATQARGRGRGHMMLLL